MPRNYTNWTQEEEQRLLDNYALLGPTEIHKRHLPHRPIGAIKRQARHLGVAGVNRRWTQDEVAILSKNYARNGPGGMTRLLPGRSVHNIGQKAAALGLSLGDSLRRVPLRRVAEQVGAEYAGMYRKARRETRLTYVGAKKYMAMVPIGWADKVIKEFEELDKNAELATFWYDMTDLARILGFTLSMVTRGFSKRGSLWDCFDEMDVRRADRTAKKLIVNPYQVEALVEKLRKGEKVLSNAQALVLLGMARGDQLSIKARPIMAGATAKKDEYWLDPADEDSPPFQVKAPAVRRCIANKLIEGQRSYQNNGESTRYVLTDLGRQAVDGLEAGMLE